MHIANFRSESSTSFNVSLGPFVKGCYGCSAGWRKGGEGETVEMVRAMSSSRSCEWVMSLPWTSCSVQGIPIQFNVSQQYLLISPYILRISFAHSHYSARYLSLLFTRELFLKGPFRPASFVSFSVASSYGRRVKSVCTNKRSFFRKTLWLALYPGRFAKQRAISWKKCVLAASALEEKRQHANASVFTTECT